MTDCSNAEIRDRLPDLLHERLDATMRAVVVAHVAECVECRDELELLRGVHKTLIARTPRVDIAYIVGALPKAPAPRREIRPAIPAPRRWSDWRIAAAVTLLIAGGGSYAVMSSHRTRMADTVAPSTAAVSPTTRAIAIVDSSPMPSVDQLVVPDDDQPAAIGNLDTRLGDLNEDQLNVLLKDMDNLRAVPASEPEPVSIRVDGNTALEDM